MTREEYDVQTQVLARAREKLAALEARVAELEARRSASPGNPDDAARARPARERAVSVAVVFSRGLTGLEAPLVRVEAHVGGGLPKFHIVGLPETEVKEARDRVRAALETARFEFPAAARHRQPRARGPAEGKRPLRPADRPRHPRGHRAGARRRASPTLEFAGELALSGELRPIRGALAMTFGAHRDGRAFVLPASVRRRGRRSRAAPPCLPARTLLEVCAHLDGQRAAAAVRGHVRARGRPRYPDLADVRGQAHARRALEVAAAGGHSILLLRPARHRQDDARARACPASCRR